VPLFPRRKRGAAYGARFLGKNTTDKLPLSLARTPVMLSPMSKKLFLLDGMALVYRAHFALMSRPIFTSKGVNTSALYGFTQTLLDILNNQKPTHIAVAFDTDAPTQRHKEFADYKAERQAMPEDLAAAMPHVRRMIEAFNIEMLECDGCEADDIIGTYVKVAEKEGFTSYMVTQDKDFGQLVTDQTFLYKPSRMGDAVEVLGVDGILNRWGIQRTEQVIDILGLMGDSSDNIPGVAGIGEKTASKLISQYGTIENVLARAGELKGKLKETLETNREMALLSKRLATIQCDVPVTVDLEKLAMRKWNDEAIKALFVEFEFNTIGKRLYGEEFKAGRGFQSSKPVAAAGTEQPDFEFKEPVIDRASLKTLKDVPHEYQIANSTEKRRSLFEALSNAKSFSIAIECSHPDPKQACLTGLAFAVSAHSASFVPLQEGGREAILKELASILANEKTEKAGHNLKQIMSVLRWHGLTVRGRLFDTLLAHSLIEPDMRHSLDYISEAYLGYSPITQKTEAQPELLLDTSAKDWQSAAEHADLALQLRAKLEPLLKEKCQERVFYEIESELISSLVDMEFEGIRVDASALAEFAEQLSREMGDCEKQIHRLAGAEFNLNSPKQLGEILFEKLRLSDKAKKTKTGQYATSEQILQELSEHEIVKRILDYRGASKLKSTYADALPSTIWSKTSRVHTTFNQAVTTTGRLQSVDPNLQNIPIRTEMGKEIRKAFVPRDKDHLILSADYSQIELRVIASLSNEESMIDAFRKGLDIHTATSAKVFGVMPELVTSEMRRKAKMVNYGISYGISAFGLAQRLGIPRREAAQIIDSYFAQYPGIRRFMTDTIEFCREHGYVETITGRRRYIRDIRSSNATVRGAAERNAINAPIQGTAADMIKIAMARIHRELLERNLKTRMLLQVHDELVFDLYKPEDAEVRKLIEHHMKTAIPLTVPIEVEMGTGLNWLEAH
jgi:DNA polymerase-1